MENTLSCRVSFPLQSDVGSRGCMFSWIEPSAFLFDLATNSTASCPFGVRREAAATLPAGSRRSGPGYEYVILIYSTSSPVLRGRYLILIVPQVGFKLFAFLMDVCLYYPLGM